MKQLFNDNWFFHKEPLDTTMDTFYQSKDWQPVDVPHDWMIYDSTDLYAQAVSCYRKTFTVENLGTDRLSLLFEGVYMDNTIYLNGEEIFTWPYGYSQFEVDLTDFVKEGENTIWVKNVYELPNSRWYPGSGIYRNVWLVQRPAVHLTTDGGYLAAEKGTDDWTLHADYEIQNETGSPCPVTLRHTICDNTGTCVCTTEENLTVPAGLTVNKQTMTFHDPLLWDITSPHLYEVHTELLQNGEVTDTDNQKFGFRTIRFDCKEGFFLNGRNVKINGSCEHHTLGALGAAMNREALRRQLKTMQDMG
ncbi:MAG: glycoside hydrolase family 2, partial [Eubacterium sp.]|nr:glycoside hydrolase family 2 [Eubacterium sp.]